MCMIKYIKYYLFIYIVTVIDQVELLVSSEDRRSWCGRCHIYHHIYHTCNLQREILMMLCGSLALLAEPVESPHAFPARPINIAK